MQSHVEINDPAAELRMPLLKMPWGEKPVDEWEESAKAPPHNLVADVDESWATAETLVANLVHLEMNVHQPLVNPKDKHALCHILTNAVGRRSQSVVVV